MADNKKRIRLATTIYWLLLFYIVAALIWWFISLEKQNHQMTDFKISQLNAALDKTQSPDQYNSTLAKIEEEHKRNLVKYVSEGFTFLLLRFARKMPSPVVSSNLCNSFETRMSLSMQRARMFSISRASFLISSRLQLPK